MKLEKINDNILKIVLSLDELPECNNLAELLSDSSRAKNSFLKLLDKASSMVGFDTTDYKIKIQAQALVDGNYVFIVTKLVNINKRKIVRPKKVIKNEASHSNFVIYKFNSFDDYCSFCSCLHSNKITYINRIAKLSTLYLYANEYYLVCEGVNESHPKIALFYSTITEFAEFFSNRVLFNSTLKEHGRVIIENKALSIGQKFFS